jgi:hypothetical protein
MTRDPLGEAGGINLYGFVDSVGKPPTQTNLYNFNFNNPVNYVDPEGEFPWMPVIGGVLIAAEVWNRIIYPLLHPEESHEHEPHLECEPAHPVDPRTQKPERLPNKPRIKPKTQGPYRGPARR